MSKQNLIIVVCITGLLNLPSFTYSYDAIEPFIDKLTVETHYLQKNEYIPGGCMSYINS